MTLVEVKTAELEGKALDWAVAKADGQLDRFGVCAPAGFKPSTDWSQGGPLIDREGTFRIIGPKHKGTTDHVARLPKGVNHWFEVCGPTPLIAAMRCLVASKLGEVVMVPRELLP